MLPPYDALWNRYKIFRLKIAVTSLQPILFYIFKLHVVINFIFIIALTMHFLYIKYNFFLIHSTYIPVFLVNIKTISSTGKSHYSSVVLKWFIDIKSHTVNFNLFWWCLETTLSWVWYYFKELRLNGCQLDNKSNLTLSATLYIGCKFI